MHEELWINMEASEEWRDSPREECVDVVPHTVFASVHLLRTEFLARDTPFGEMAS